MVKAIERNKERRSSITLLENIFKIPQVNGSSLLKCINYSRRFPQLKKDWGFEE